ncbi:SOS response-associated peptidase [soil metagenome]
MCGRFSITGDLDFYAEYFGIDDIRTQPLEPSWNVAPTDPVYVVAESEGKRSLGSMKWGLVPHWAKDRKSIQINARVETVATTSMFRDSFARKRCLIPADGFYEWEPAESGRSPHWIYRADGHPMVFAGIWASRMNENTQEWERTCSILTTEAGGTVRDIHHRMPVAMVPDVWDAWLDREMTDPETALDLVRTVDPDEIMQHEVSKRVNSVKNNDPDLTVPAAPDTLF